MSNVPAPADPQNQAKQLYSSAFALFGEGHLAEAEALYRKALVFLPDSGLLLSDLGTILVMSRRFEEGSALLKRAVVLKPNRLLAQAYLALSEHALGRDAAPLLQRIVLADAAKRDDRALQAWAALQLDQPEKAFSLEIEGLNLLPYAAFDTLGRTPDLAPVLAALPVVEGARPAMQGPPLIYASMDGAYARIFARKLVASALQKSPGCDVHLHLMNPDGFVLEGFPEDRVTCSGEAMPPDRTLYSTRRFVRLAQFALDRTVIALDADSIVNRDIVAALPTAFDVVMYARSDSPWLHQMFNAGFMAIAPAGRDVLRFLAAYILHFETAGRARWFDDQLGLAAAATWFKAYRPDIAIVSAPPQMMDWSSPPDPASVVWHFKGLLKNASAV